MAIRAAWGPPAGGGEQALAPQPVSRGRPRSRAGWAEVGGQLAEDRATRRGMSRLGPIRKARGSVTVPAMAGRPAVAAGVAPMRRRGLRVGPGTFRPDRRRFPSRLVPFLGRVQAARRFVIHL
jgi:hypothetical protein